MSWWEVSCSPNKLLVEWFRGWSFCCPSARCGRAWGGLFFAIVWTIWESPNQVVFKGKVADLYQAIDIVKFKVTCWFKHYEKGSNDQISTLLLNLKEVCVDSVVVKRSKIEG